MREHREFWNKAVRGYYPDVQSRIKKLPTLKLPPRRLEVFLKLGDMLIESGNTPVNYRSLAENLGISSLGSVHPHLTYFRKFSLVPPHRCAFTTAGWQLYGLLTS